MANKIRYIRELVYYDGPLVFEARDAIGGHYIGVLGAPVKGGTRALITGVAPEKLNAFCSGAKDLRELILESDSDSRYTTRAEALAGSVDELDVIAFREPLEESQFLPDPGFVLVDPLPPAELDADLAKNRLELTLDEAPGRIGLRAYTDLIYLIQGLVKHALAPIRHAEGVRRPAFLWKHGIFDVVTPAIPGSFRVMLAPSAEQDPAVFNEKLDSALDRVFSTLFDHSRQEDAEALVGALISEEGAALSRSYLELLDLGQ